MAIGARPMTVRRTPTVFVCQETAPCPRTLAPSRAQKDNIVTMIIVDIISTTDALASQGLAVHPRTLALSEVWKDVLVMIMTVELALLTSVLASQEIAPYPRLLAHSQTRKGNTVMTILAGKILIIHALANQETVPSPRTLAPRQLWMDIIALIMAVEMGSPMYVPASQESVPNRLHVRYSAANVTLAKMMFVIVEIHHFSTAKISVTILVAWSHAIVRKILRKGGGIVATTTHVRILVQIQTWKDLHVTDIAKHNIVSAR